MCWRKVIATGKCQQCKTARLRTLTQPVIDPQIWKNVPDKQTAPTEVPTDLIQSKAYKTDPEIAQHNQLGVFGLI